MAHGALLSRLLLAGALAALPSGAAAQQGPLVRADLSGMLGWQLARTESPGPYPNRQWHGDLFGGAAAGVYWTDHLKTELDFGAATEARAYRSYPIVIEGRQVYRSSILTFSRRTLGISQQYQFFRNAWFHPHVAAGANVTWERQVEHVHPLVLFDPLTRESHRLEDAARAGPRTELTVRPFASGGFKAYFTRRAFFRADLRLAVRNGIDESLLRAGFGIDF
ncbi:MAG TPA: hypothetical protein VM364_12895 [Vicinamibacterales bacterium]|nr:hypothetical protein [Vicinamibacterales bacterium]